MSQLCPDGHASELTDFCTECGIAMQAVASSAASPAQAIPAAQSPGPQCSNCSEPHGKHDVFCENCGFDFSSGSLPDAAEESSSAPDPAAAAVPLSLTVTVSVDPAYFAEIVESGEVVLPDPVPAPTTLTLSVGKALIGRHSESRGIFPEIDVESLTDDPAVSSRHAMLHRTDEGTWEINDLGSTNGTRIGDPAGDELHAGTAVALEPGIAVYVGAWTRIEITS